MNWTEYAMADDREFLACVAQAMIEDVWAAIFDEDLEVKAIEKAEREMDEQLGDNEALDLVHGDGNELDFERGAQSSMDLDPMDLPNRQLAVHISRHAQGYKWNSDQEEDCDVVKFGDADGYKIKLAKRGTTLVNGRGNVSIAYAYPPAYAEPIRWWAENVRWERPKEGSLQNEPSRTASYLECVIDFELSTGFRIGLDGATATTWANKAKVLAYTIRALARIYGLKKSGVGMSLAQALEPRTDAASLTPLGAPLTSGYGVRPRWLSRWTTQAAAVNTWRARRHEAVNRPWNREACRGRRFAEDWEINYHSFPADDLWEAEVARTLKKALLERKEIHRREFEAKMADPVKRRETAWTCDRCWTRAAYLTPEQAQIREDQMRSGKKVDVGSDVYCKLCTASMEKGGGGLDPPTAGGAKRRRTEMQTVSMDDATRGRANMIEEGEKDKGDGPPASQMEGVIKEESEQCQRPMRLSKRPAVQSAAAFLDDAPQPKWTRKQKAEGAPGTREAEQTQHGVGAGCVVLSEGDACVPGAGASSSSSVSVFHVCPTCGRDFRPLHFRRIRAGTIWRGTKGEAEICARCYLSYSSGKG